MDFKNIFRINASYILNASARTNCLNFQTAQRILKKLGLGMCLLFVSSLAISDRGEALKHHQFRGKINLRFLTGVSCLISLHFM